MLPFMEDDSDEGGVATMIAKMSKDEIKPEMDPAQEARKVAMQKMMHSLKSEDLESFMNAMDELKEIDRT